MPNLKNAKKALRQSVKHARHNKLIRDEIHSLRVKARKLIEARQMREAKDLALMIAKKLDKAAQKNVFKKNTVARYKSRLMKKVNAMAKM